MNVFDLVASLKLDKGEYEESLESAKSEGESFGQKLGSALSNGAKVAGVAVTAVGTAVVGVGKSFVDGVSSVGAYADSIDKASQKLGISAEAYQEWDFIAQHSGTSVDTLKGSMKKLVSAVDTGSDAFKEIGLSMDEVKGMSQEELFSAVITQLQGMEEGTERTALAQKLLGKGAQELAPLLNTSAEATEEMRKQAHDLGGVLSDEAVKAGADFEDSLQNLQTSITGLKNGALAEFLPACSKVMNGLTKIFSGEDGGVAEITEGIDSIIDSITSALPMISETAVKIIESIGTALISNAPMLIESATSIVMSIGEFIISNLPMLIDTALQLILTISQGIVSALPTLIPSIISVVLTIVDNLLDNIDMLIDCAIELIIGLTEGIISALPLLIEKIPTIIIKIGETLIRNLPKLLSAMAKLVTTLWDGIKNNLPTLIAKIPQIITQIKDKLAEGVEKMKEIGKNLIEGLWNGINDKVEWIKEKIKGFKDAVIDGIKSFFGVHSPSTVFAEIGGYLAEGLGVGWDDEISDVKKDINNSLKFDLNASANQPRTERMQSNIQPIIVQSEVELGVNAKRMLNIVAQQNKIETRATGYNQLAMA